MSDEGMISGYSGPEEITIDMPKDITVMLGMPIGKPTPPHTIVALCDTVQQAAYMGLQLSHSFHVCGVVEITRDSIVDAFLKSKARKLFLIDNDISWGFDAFIRALALSCVVDVVTAAYPSRTAAPDMASFGIYGFASDEIGPFGMRDVLGLGMGFTVIDRKVIEALVATKPRVRDRGVEMAAVFRVDIDENGDRRTEDNAFFADIRALGYRVWCDPEIELGHVGEHEWRGRFADALADAAKRAAQPVQITSDDADASDKAYAAALAAVDAGELR